MKFEQTIVKENFNGKLQEKEVLYSIDGNKVEKLDFYDSIGKNILNGWEVKEGSILEKTVETGTGTNTILSMNMILH